MGIYTSTSVNSYNANPPPDDGTVSSQNQINWSTIKSKLSDPLNTFASSVDSNITTAFGKTLDGGSVVGTAGAYAMAAADQGRLIKATASAITITTPDAAVVGTQFVAGITNQSTGSITLAANAAGGQTVDGQTTQAIAAGAGCIIKSDGTNWFSFGLTAAQQLQALKPQGYLSLNNALTIPIVVTDTVSVTSVYYTPFVGNQISIYNGTQFVNYSFSQLTLTLVSNHVANTLYDVFVFLNAGVVTIGTGPAWSASGAGAGARGSGAGTTQINNNNGILVNTVAATMRNGSTTYSVLSNQGTYVGTIAIDSVAGQITCHVSYGQSRKWGVWNAYNRLPVILQAGDSTASWTYNTNTWRASNNASANSMTIIAGLQFEPFLLQFSQFAFCQGGAGVSAQANLGIGFNSTSAPTGTVGTTGWSNNSTGTDGVYGTPNAVYQVIGAQIGIHTITALEKNGIGAGTATFNGTQTNMLLSAAWNA